MTEKILSRIKKSAPAYGSLPFWSWNDRLDPEELRRQIRAMRDIGMKGFFMHARGGLETEYLSDEWFAAIAASVDEAKKWDMEAWSYDENGWPSGFAGGILLTDGDNHARYLSASVEDTYPTGENILGVWHIADGKCTVATPDTDGPFHVIREGADGSYVDVLRADITEKFIAATHAEYKRRVGDDFGGAMPGFFTDEPQYYRWATPYSRSLPEKFREKYGYEVKTALPALFWDFEGDTALRYDYYLIIHELFMQNFIRPIYDWCEANGCMLTGHAVEESFLSGQMWSCGGVMPFYQYEHIPGIDYLGRGIASDLASRQLGSVCAQTGRKKALSEMFACAGWDVSPRELKRIAEMQYAGGVNLMCQHLYPYSERGQRKRDYPAHYSEHNPWHKKMLLFDTYFANLGALLAEGEEDVDTLVIHPIRAAYRTYKRKEDRASIATLEGDTAALVAALGHAQIPYHFGDESMLATMGACEGDAIRLGLCRYRRVIVPKMETLSGTTVALLREFLAAGGKLCFVGDVPGEIDGRAAEIPLCGNITFDEIRAAAPVRIQKDGEDVPALRQRTRVIDGKRLLFTANITETDVFGARMTVENCAGAVGIDVMTLRTYPLAGERNADGSLTVAVDLPAAASFVLLEDGDAAMLPLPAHTGRAAAITVPASFTLTEKPENVLTLDRVAVSTDGAPFSEMRPIERVRDNLLAARYEGELALRYAFTADFVPAHASLVWEGASVTSVSVNGTAVAATGFLAPDTAFLTAEIAPLVRPGENEIVLTYRYYQKPLVYDVLFGNAMESLRNCLCFDTEIEAVYVKGDFRVKTDPARFADSVRSSVLYDGDFTLTAPSDKIDMRSVVQDGFPFYGGALTGETTLTWHPGEGTVLRPASRFACVTAWVNGEAAGEAFFSDEIDLAPYLRDGENTLRVRIEYALRNTAGPFHRADPEPYGVSPTTFSYEKEWRDADTCKSYNPRYAFVRVGI